MQLFRSLMTTLMLILPFAFISTTADAGEEKSYKLEQMRKQSQSSEKEPTVQMPADDSDLIAGSDTDSSQQYDDKEFSDVGEIKPSFEKPKLEPYKPE